MDFVLSIGFRSLSIIATLCLLVSGGIFSYANDESIVIIFIAFWPIFLWLIFEFFDQVGMTYLERLLYTSIPIYVYGFGGSVVNLTFSFSKTYFEAYQVLYAYLFLLSFAIVPLYYLWARIIEFLFKKWR